MRSVYPGRMDTTCSRPVPVRNSGGARLVRCRQCPPCLRAAQRYWAAAAANQIRTAHSSGSRSWFGTCTFRREEQETLLIKAMEEFSKSSADWDALPSIERFAYLQNQALNEVQKFWKRLRKRGLSFKYIAAFEADQSGKPHMHCLLHESDPARPIRKRELDVCWSVGFTNWRLLKLSPSGQIPYGAIAYVTKSFAKQHNWRVCASSNYQPERQLPKSERPHQLRFVLGK